MFTGCCTTCTSGDRMSTSQRIHRVVHSSFFLVVPWITCKDSSSCNAAVSSTSASHACIGLYAVSVAIRGALLHELFAFTCCMQPGARHAWSAQGPPVYASFMGLLFGGGRRGRTGRGLVLATPKEGGRSSASSSCVKSIVGGGIAGGALATQTRR